ncbi:penicillin-binding protein 1A [Haloferula luteola]|uniref:peptidoglycan glycosyltransferase n=1 Tax=Haloferula luteola TaxID=595692 RepID=A0A840VD68_9BACT|nr:transglycosylase domain-containing protein [Haloferula luteola]MBB5351759.1 penicillin-binding protein 1A [Haloferula luteola]
MSTWRPVSRPPRWLAWLPGWVLTLLKFLLWGTLGGALIGFCLALFFFARAARFDLDEVEAMPARTTILDRDDNPIEVSWGSSRHLANRQDLPAFLVQCLEAREDARFFHHCGVDFRGLARATVRNLKDGDFTQGASTLTMQLARNTFEIREKSIQRKLLEIALTLRIEQRYSKDEILTHYLNRIYFGAGCHGVDEAARTYFGKPVSQLSEGESAMIVGIIRGPHLFSPARNLDGARAQQSEVLDRLIAMGRITAADKTRIQAQPIEIIPEEQRSAERSYAVQAVRKELDDILDALDIRLDGLVVHTTLSPGWQLTLETDISNCLLEAERGGKWDHPTHQQHTAGSSPAYLQCAAVTLESRTGAVLALVGGRDFLDSRYDRSTGARRDLGTAFTPWVAAAAAERGKRVLPNNVMLTGRQIGPIETARIAQRCGIGGPFQKTEDLFRGSVASTPMEAAVALTTLANRGKRPSPFLVSRISNPSGEVLYTREADLSQAITPAAAQEATSLFESVGVSRCFEGHTGSERDAWLFRIGPGGSTAIWLGFDTPEKIAEPAPLRALLDRLGERLSD